MKFKDMLLGASLVAGAVVGGIIGGDVGSVSQAIGFLGVGTLLSAISSLGGLLGDDEQQTPQLLNPESLNRLIQQLEAGRSGQQGQTSSLFGQARGAVTSALGGNLGLSPQIMALMGNRLNRQLDPGFAQSRDALRRSFNPRLAGSGVAGSALGTLLGQQSQSRALGQSGIQIQDALGRQQGQLAGLSGIQNLFGQQQSAGLSTQALLAQLLGTRV